MKKLIRFSWLLVLPLMAAGIVWTASSRTASSLGQTVLLPNPSDCSTFFHCSDDVVLLMHCPDGLHFNRALDTCDWPSDADCAGDFGVQAGNNTYCNLSHSYARELMLRYGGIVCSATIGNRCVFVGVDCPN